MMSNDANLSVITAHQLASLLQNAQDIGYVVHLLFQVRSLSAL